MWGCGIIGRTSPEIFGAYSGYGCALPHLSIEPPSGISDMLSVLQPYDEIGWQIVLVWGDFFRFVGYFASIPLFLCSGGVLASLVWCVISCVRWLYGSGADGGFVLDGDFALAAE